MQRYDANAWLLVSVTVRNDTPECQQVRHVLQVRDNKKRAREDSYTCIDLLQCVSVKQQQRWNAVLHAWECTNIVCHLVRVIMQQLSVERHAHCLHWRVILSTQKRLNHRFLNRIDEIFSNIVISTHYVGCKSLQIKERIHSRLKTYLFHKSLPP